MRPYAQQGFILDNDDKQVVKKITESKLEGQEVKPMTFPSGGVVGLGLSWVS